MERIELFDQYIEGKLSDAEVSEFKKQLESDEDFAADFNIYLITVRGICQEAEQDNIEFGHAMKAMSKEQLESVIGKPEKQIGVRKNFFRERVMWISSIAAMFIIAVGIGWGLYDSSQNQLCDVVYNLSYSPVGDARSAGGECPEYVNLNNLTNEQVKDLIPRMKAAFEADEVDSQDWHIDGMNLAMAYLKLHHKDDAVKVLKELAANSSDPEKYNRIIEQFK